MSQFFVGKNSPADLLMDADSLMRADADYYGPRFEAIKELRALDDGTLHRGNEFRRVASLVNVPMAQVVSLLDPEWMKDKKKFYGWLGRHPEFKTYESKGGSKPRVTFNDGDQVVG
jgi:hypothetical protein